MKLLEKINFKFSKAEIAVFAIIVLNYLIIRTFGITEIPENSLLEDLQFFVLLFGTGLCVYFRNKVEDKFKPLYVLGAMLFFLLALREVSYGRVFFCHVEGGGPDDFYPWKHYKYGFLAHYIIGLYIAIMAIYGIIKKVWNEIIFLLTKIKFPFWMYFISVLSVIVQIYSEHYLDKTCLEETSELVIYCCVIALACLYYKEIKKSSC